MFKSSVKKEIRAIERMDRPELIDHLLEMRAATKVRLPWHWVNGQSLEKLRCLLLAAHLFRALQEGRPPASGVSLLDKNEGASQDKRKTYPGERHGRFFPELE